MTTLAFLQSKPVRRLLDRANRAASAPVAVHFYRGHEEGLRITGSGRCEACAAVSNQPGGTQACRSSRNQAAATAVSQGVVMPFVCHMGFACAAVRAIPNDPDTGEGYSMTFGPYCPAEGAPALANDAALGLERLEYPVDDADMDALLEDIPIRSPDSIFEIASWTAETLTWLWEQSHLDDGVEDPAPDEPEVSVTGSSRKRKQTLVIEHHNARTIATALAGNQMARTRRLITAELDEIGAPKKRANAIRRARAGGLAMAVLEAAETAGMSTTQAWASLPRLLSELQKATDRDTMVEGLIDTLGVLRRKEAQGPLRNQGLDALTRLVTEHMEQGITLQEVARQLNEHPTAITHRLQRKFGISYSEFVARLRIDRAKELLRRTKLSIGDVAARVGVGDPSNLGRLFRRHEGLSPSDYRRRYGGSI